MYCKFVSKLGPQSNCSK